PLALLVRARLHTREVVTRHNWLLIQIERGISTNRNGAPAFLHHHVGQKYGHARALCGGGLDRGILRFGSRRRRRYGGFCGLGRRILLYGRRLAGSQRQQSRQERASSKYSGAFHRLPLLTNRKSTRLNSSHVKISYAVFCLNKK